MKPDIKLTAVYEEAQEGGYVAYIEELPGVNTQGASLDEAKENLYEALQLVLEVNREISQKESSKKTTIKETFSLVS